MAQVTKLAREWDTTVKPYRHVDSDEARALAEWIDDKTFPYAGNDPVTLELNGDALDLLAQMEAGEVIDPQPRYQEDDMPVGLTWQEAEAWSMRKYDRANDAYKAEYR